MGDGSNEDLGTSLFQPGENDMRVSLYALISNFMHLAQVFQIEKDLNIVWKTSHHVTFPQVTMKPQIQVTLKI